MSGKTVKLFCANLAWEVTDEELKNDIGEMAHAPVVEANIAIDKNTGRSRGFGFIIVDEEDADDFLALNGGKYAGRKFIIEIAKEKPDIPYRKREPNFNH